MGTPAKGGEFLEVGPGYYLPMKLEGKQVLFKKGTCGSGPMSSAQPCYVTKARLGASSSKRRPDSKA